MLWKHSWVFHAAGLILTGSFIGSCGLLNNTSQETHKHEGDIGTLLDVNGSPADVIFHPFSQSKPSQFTSNWCIFTEVPGAPFPHNWLLFNSSYSSCNENETQSLKTKMLLCTLNALHLENPLHDNTAQLGEWLLFHLRTNGNRRIMQPLLQRECALYRSLTVFRCLYNWALTQSHKGGTSCSLKQPDASAVCTDRSIVWVTLRAVYNSALFSFGVSDTPTDALKG